MKNKKALRQNKIQIYFESIDDRQIVSRDQACKQSSLNHVFYFSLITLDGILVEIIFCKASLIEVTGQIGS